MRKKVLFLIPVILFLNIFTITSLAGNKTTVESKADLDKVGMKVGVGEGSSAVLIAEKELPNAELVYIDGVSGYQAVAMGKIDAYIFERMQMELAIENGLRGVRLLDENMDESIHIACGISPKSSVKDLESKLNEFIRMIKSDGTLDDMTDRWVIKKEDEMPGIKLSSDPKQHLIVGTTGVVPPYSYYKGAELAGFDIELALRFAAFIDADVEFKVYDYNGIIPAAASGDVDCIMANLNVTPERARALAFSDDIFEQQVGIMVRDEGATNGATNFAGKVKDSFVSTFVLENRWVLFVRGILVTVFITVMGILLGSGLGFLIYMLCRGGNLFLNRLNDVFSRIILGMPMVVLLMVLYYIIFGNVSISPVAVSVIGFTMSFACSVFGLLRLGESSIDKGQYDAAYALGHSKNNTFFRIILPQVLPMIMDSYKGEITGLIKATAIVGYIAVQDLTKVGDIVRSRTYDAFFPLIAIAAIYFIMEWIFMIIVKKLQAWLDPKKERGRKLLKGVVLHDKD